MSDFEKFWTLFELFLQAFWTLFFSVQKAFKKPAICHYVTSWLVWIQSIGLHILILDYKLSWIYIGDAIVELVGMKLLWLKVPVFLIFERKAGTLELHNFSMLLTIFYPKHVSSSWVLALLRDEKRLWKSLLKQELQGAKHGIFPVAGFLNAFF